MNKDWIRTSNGWLNIKTGKVLYTEPTDAINTAVRVTRPQTVRKPVFRRKMNGFVNGVLWSDGKRYTGMYGGHYYRNGIRGAEVTRAQRRTRSQQASNNQYGIYLNKTKPEREHADQIIGDVMNVTRPSHIVQSVANAANEIKDKGVKKATTDFVFDNGYKRQNNGIFGPGGIANSNGESGEFANFLFDIAAPVAATKALSAATGAARNTKDAAWAINKTFFNPKTTGGRSIVSGSFKYKAKGLADFLKNPSRNRLFFLDFNNGGLFDLSNKNIAKADPLFNQIALKYGWKPKANFANWEDPATTAAQVDRIMQVTRNHASQYADRINYIRNSGNKALQNIAETSPQYTDKIYTDLVNGNVGDTESYVKNLINDANTFEREMRPIGYEDLDEDNFAIISGRYGGEGKASMDVGDARVASGYGNTTGYYGPNSSALQLKGPVESWWSQRFPSGLPAGTLLQTRGIHTNNLLLNEVNKVSIPGAKPQDQVAIGFKKHLDVPDAYGDNTVHMRFVGKPGDDIWGGYDVSLNPDDIPSTEGLGLYGNDLKNGVYTWQSEPRYSLYMLSVNGNGK